ncbi:MAG: endonuclease [Bacillales bacterium]|jgi:putative restriction endonuclease|nr:endonuclease [Bacillales bacterium]
MNGQPNHERRAFIAWDVLIKQVKKSKTITYKELADQVGVHWRACRFFLDFIQNYCIEEGVPPLTSIVVNAKGKVGKGFIAYDVNSLAECQEKVFNFNWLIYINPFQYTQNDDTQSKLVDDLLILNKSKEVYVKVKSRGVAQSLFRKALLDAYQTKCAFCNFRFPEALEAAHIVPWSMANDEEKLDVRNGLLLCSKHHKLFDKNIFMIAEDYTIKIKDSYKSKKVGQKINLPSNKQYLPIKEYINKRLSLI